MPDPLYDHLDTVYGPMQWVAKWSDGSNIPFGLCVPRQFQDILKAPDFYKRGLILFNSEGGCIPVDGGRPGDEGVTVTAYTRRHAVALFWAAVMDQPAPTSEAAP